MLIEQQQQCVLTCFVLQVGKNYANKRPTSYKTALMTMTNTGLGPGVVVFITGFRVQGLGSIFFHALDRSRCSHHASTLALALASSRPPAAAQVHIGHVTWRVLLLVLTCAADGRRHHLAPSNERPGPAQMLLRGWRR